MSALFDTVLEPRAGARGRPGRAAAAADLVAGLFHLRRPHRRGPHQRRHAQGRRWTCWSAKAPDGKSYKGRINQVLTFEGLERMQATEAGPGDIVLINGIADIGIGVTITDPPTRRRCPC
jgi:GTP-binding protein